MVEAPTDQLETVNGGGKLSKRHGSTQAIHCTVFVYDGAASAIASHGWVEWTRLTIYLASNQLVSTVPSPWKSIGVMGPEFLRPCSVPYV